MLYCLKHKNNKTWEERQMSDVSVVSVKPDCVVIAAGKIELTFGMLSGKLKVIARSSYERYTPDGFYVPKELFAQACRQAAAILIKDNVPKQ